jgi:hypothetical protein
MFWTQIDLHFSFSGANMSGLFPRLLGSQKCDIRNTFEIHSKLSLIEGRAFENHVNLSVISIPDLLQMSDAPLD